MNWNWFWRNIYIIYKNAAASLMSIWGCLYNYFLIFSSAEKTKGLSLVGDRRPWQGNCLEWEEKEFHHWRKASQHRTHSRVNTQFYRNIFLNFLIWGHFLDTIILLEMIFRKCYHIWGPLECVDLKAAKFYKFVLLYIYIIVKQLLSSISTIYLSLNTLI